MGFIGSNERFSLGSCRGSWLYPRLKASKKLRPLCRDSPGTCFPKYCTTKQGITGTYHSQRFGDSAFPRYTWLMKSYNENTRDPRKRYFNKRLCSARVVSEHAYSMLKGRWRILYKKTECKLKNIRHVIMALHSLAQYMHCKR